MSSCKKILKCTNKRGNINHKNSANSNKRGNTTHIKTQRKYYGGEAGTYQKLFGITIVESNRDVGIRGLTENFTNIAQATSHSCSRSHGW
jgi:hypothetical protein